MSQISYYDDQHTRNGKLTQRSVTVRIDDRIECTGRGHWDSCEGDTLRDVSAQIKETFSNIDYALQEAGVDWKHVYKVTSYHAPLNNEAMEAMKENLKDYMPGQNPMLTCVGVTRLAEDDMMVQIEVVAMLRDSVKHALGGTVL